ncbi:MAG: hypothetical protein RL501_1493 [Bacteroidota bacterium]|jgi:dipeptidyl-peptidase-4
MNHINTLRGWALGALACMFIVHVPELQAQTKSITIEEIYNGTFRTQGMDALRSRNNGTEYTVLQMDRATKTQSIDLFDYATLSKVGTLLSTQDVPEVGVFSSYTFSPDETKVLLHTQIEPIYRRSRLGIYYVYDFTNRSLVQLTNHKIQEPTFSPDGSKVAYGYQNNLYYVDLITGVHHQITQDGEKNAIINGITDWVYEEEFSFVRAFDWNSNGTALAWIRFDERAVPEFSMDIYGSALYPTQQVFKYPKAGEANAVVSVHVYQLSDQSVHTVPVSAEYIPRLQWRNNPNWLSLQTLNRHQNELTLHNYEYTTGTLSVLHTEKDAAYVDVTFDLTFLEDDRYIWSSEASGYNHLYLYGANGKMQRQITQGPWEVTSYYGYDAKTKQIFFQSTTQSSIQRDVYAIGINGKGMRRLSPRSGTNHAVFSADYTYFINNHSSAQSPPSYTLHRTHTLASSKESGASGALQLRTIVDNSPLLEQLSGYTLGQKTFGTLSVHGNDLNLWMIKPKDFDPNKKYPLLMFQYSGPGSQSVSDSWMGGNDYWYHMLAEKGYVIACVDGRGTGFKGRDFKKSTYLTLVHLETEDQIEAGRKLSELPFIDPDRTGIWGWSFGGDMAVNCILKGADVFETAISVAPVTNWRFYDSVYTERFMRTPQENPEGYDQNAPMNFAHLLKGNLLLVHGTADDNVHVQNSMRLIEALVQANKPFDWAIYPDKNHGIYGGKTREHLYEKMTQFLLDKL